MSVLDFRAPVRSESLAHWLGRVGVEDAVGRWVGAETHRGRPIGLWDAVPPGTRVRVRLRGPDPETGPGVAGPGTAAWPERVEAIVPAPPWARGEIAGAEGGAGFRFETLERRAAIARIAIRWEGGSPGRLLDALARAGWPALGDLRRGGVLVAGGLRAGPADGGGAGAWPDEPVRPGESDGAPPPGYAISAAAARALGRGHPWLLPDEASDDPDRFAPGALVALRDPRGRGCGLARIDGDPAVSARVWSRAAGTDGDPADAEARVAAALARRRALLEGAAGAGRTDVFRLVHGEADGLPGVAVDRLGPWLRVVHTSRALEPLRDRLLAALRGQLSEWLGGGVPVVEVIHLRSRPPGRLESVRVAAGRWPGGRLRVWERGLCFEVEPGLDEPSRPRPGFGLFPDQRENRARLAERARRGGRWLNLFAHTGAFSAALLAAGAEEVVSVDLSRPYLEWLEANLALNGLQGARHRSERSDGRRYLERLGAGERFDGIVLDPPTAAAAGRRYWSVGRGLEPLVAQALGRLTPGGCLLVCRNDRGARRTRLDDWLRGVAERAGVALADVRLAPPGSDFPSLAGFPEGDPFRGVLACRAEESGRRRGSRGARGRRGRSGILRAR